MKKMILGFIAIVVTLSFVFANNTGNSANSGNNNTPKDSTMALQILKTEKNAKEAKPKKGQIMVTSDSAIVYRASDSLLAKSMYDNNDLLPAGFTMTAKPR